MYEKIYKEFEIDESNRAEWALFSDRNKIHRITNTKNTKAVDVIAHGEMLFLFQTSASVQNETTEKIEEDEVDIELAKQDGRINRGKDPQLCHHGPSGKCIHCVPAEPYDLEYLKSINPSIKYISFHAYLKKLQGGIDKLD